MVEKKKKTKSPKKKITVKKAKPKNTTQKISQESYKLGSALDISHVERMHKEVIKYLKGNKNLIFDASKVERITTPCIQLLMSVANQAKKDNDVKFSIKSPSPAFELAMEDLGMINELNNWRI